MSSNRLLALAKNKIHMTDSIHAKFIFMAIRNGVALIFCWLFAASAAEKQTYIYKTVGDLKIEADVYRPPGEGPFPAILMLHGGALMMGSRNLGSQQLDRYLGAGYAVVSADYRLAPETKASGIFEDLCDAWRWLRTEKSLRIAPNRIAVTGGSAGGYLALVQPMAAARNGPLSTCIAARRDAGRRR
jgi:acetyl esterase/lipase